MATVDMELALVRRFYSVCQRFESRPTIARRNTMPTLVRFLDSTEREVRKVALESLFLLAEHPDNVDVLATNTTLEDGLSRLTQETRYDDPELHELACRVIALLAVAPSVVFDEAVSQPTHNDDEEQYCGSDARRIDADTTSGETGSRWIYTACASSTGQCPGERRDGDENGAGSFAEPDKVGCSGDGSVLGQSAAPGTTASTPCRSTCEPRVAQSVVRSSMSDVPYMLTVDIPALNARSDTAALEHALQSTQGVVSYTILGSAHQVRVFMSARGDAALQQALAQAGYASLVVGAERMTVASEHFGTPMRAATRSYFDKEAQRPSYLQKARSLASSMYNAVVLYGGAQNQSLAARVERQRQVDEGQRSATVERLAKAFTQWW